MCLVYRVCVSWRPFHAWDSLGDDVRFDVYATPYVASVTPQVATSGKEHPVYIDAGFRTQQAYPLGSYTYTSLAQSKHFKDPGGCAGFRLVPDKRVRHMLHVLWRRAGCIKVRYVAKPLPATGPSALAGASFRFQSEKVLKPDEAEATSSWSKSHSYHRKAATSRGGLDDVDAAATRVEETGGADAESSDSEDSLDDV